MKESRPALAPFFVEGYIHELRKSRPQCSAPFHADGVSRRNGRGVSAVQQSLQVFSALTTNRRFYWPSGMATGS